MGREETRTGLVEGRRDGVTEGRMDEGSLCMVMGVKGVCAFGGRGTEKGSKHGVERWTLMCLYKGVDGVGSITLNLL